LRLILAFPSVRLRLVRLLAAALATALGGCTEPGLQVRFTIPAAYQAATTAIRLQIVEPSEQAPFGCDEVAFGAVTEETVRLRTAIEVTVEGGDADLSGVRREGDKLFVAEALDAQGLPVAAACGAHGTIENDVIIDLVGEPATLGVLADEPRNDPVETPPLSGPTNITLELRDALDAPLADAPVRWMTLGPGAETLDAVPGTWSDANGAVTITVTPTSLAGPALVEPRPRWARERVQEVRFFQPPVAASYPLPWLSSTHPSQDEIPQAFAVGPIGPERQPGVLALGPLDPSAGRMLHYRYFVDREPLGDDRSFPLPVADPALPLVVVVHQTRAAALSQANWYAPGSEGLLADPLPARPMAAAAAGRCDGSSDEIVVMHEVGIAVLDGAADYAMVPSHPVHGWTGLELVDSGCVGEHRVIAFKLAADAQTPPPMCTTLPTLVLWSDIGGGSTRCDTTALLPSVGFGDLLLLPRFEDDDGFTVDGMRLELDDGGGFALERQTRIPTLFPAVSPRAADFDGDQKLDVVAAVIAETEAGSDLDHHVFLSLGAEHRGERLVGFGSRTGGPLPLLFTGPLDDDVYDDFIVATPLQYIVAFMGPPS